MFQPMQEALLWATQLLNSSIPFLGPSLNGVVDQTVTTYTTLDSFSTHCASFASSVSIPNAQIHFSQYVPAGTNISLEDNHPSCGVNSWVVPSDICRVAMSVATSNESEMSVEAWFPYDYAGRFLVTTNRGLGGCILYNELEHTTSLGFASMGMNTGYNGSTASPLLQNPNAIADYAYRSAHTGTISGKALTEHFYGVPSRRSYYLGCSSGGRQGFKEAQDFPDDFDGILAGAPALGLTRIVSWGNYLSKTVGPPDGESFLNEEEWGMVYEEVMKQCDGLDGAVDGIIEDPDKCWFIPETLICSSSSNLKGQKKGKKGKKSCLTSKQAETVRKIFSPLYGLDGELIYPRMQPGINTKRQLPFYFDGTPSPLAEDWFRHVVYNDTTWSGNAFTLQDASIALHQNPFNVETYSGDLSRFASRGGKLLSYHGLQDYVIPSEISQLYYAHVSRTMSLPPEELDEFYRLFFVSGMDHCRDGDGAWGIGQDKGAYANANTDTSEEMGSWKNPDQNALMTLVRWVEEGVPPEVLRGVKLAEDGMMPVYWRKHCKWPKKNRYVGSLISGETAVPVTEEDAWVCE
ncbi:ferulic acid esterase [Dendrothele bispora CBS 962.96]|uniref:Carboxylic ester hydrolase n=1 Tax=Dendrothele bispora (strain CBS 962.96) TaxID=1314807 RepID=A0A4S8MFF4_DENBC|nr:ferulic acid esterase [Dendrothele bispora CBS 962.96]